MFNPDTAQTLQQLAVFLEVTGLSLIIIEMYMPNITIKIENFLKKQSESVNLPKMYHDVLMENWILMDFSKDDIKKCIYSLIRSSVLIGILFFTLDKMNFIDNLIYYNDINYVSLIVLVILTLIVIYKSSISLFILIIVIASALVFMIFICFSFIKFYLFSPINIVVLILKKMAKNKALAALGLILAILGTFCEIYQIGEMCLNTGCYGHPPLRDTYSVVSSLL